MPTAPTPITPYGTPPSSDDPTNFDARADAKVAQDAVFVGEANALGSNVFANALEAYNAAVAALASAATALAHQQAAAANAEDAASSAGATAWNAATNYSVGQRAWSLIDAQLYRRIVAGVTATDPKLDQTNWARVWIEPELVTAESFYF